MENTHADNYPKIVRADLRDQIKLDGNPIVNGYIWGSMAAGEEETVCFLLESALLAWIWSHVYVWSWTTRLSLPNRPLECPHSSHALALACFRLRFQIHYVSSFLLTCKSVRTVVRQRCAIAEFTFDSFSIVWSMEVEQNSCRQHAWGGHWTPLQRDMQSQTALTRKANNPPTRQIHCWLADLQPSSITALIQECRSAFKNKSCEW